MSKVHVDYTSIKEEKSRPEFIELSINRAAAACPLVKMWSDPLQELKPVQLFTWFCTPIIIIIISI